jgi:hypothetical protein
MPSDDAINALLTDGARIIISAMSGDGLTVSHYVDGGGVAPGRFRWIDCVASDPAAIQASVIETALNG